MIDRKEAWALVAQLVCTLEGPGPHAPALDRLDQLVGATQNADYAGGPTTFSEGEWTRLRDYAKTRRQAGKLAHQILHVLHPECE